MPKQESIGGLSMRCEVSINPLQSPLGKRSLLILCLKISAVAFLRSKKSKRSYRAISLANRRIKLAAKQTQQKLLLRSRGNAKAKRSKAGHLQIDSACTGEAPLVAALKLKTVYAVVAAYVFRHPIHHEQLRQTVNDVSRFESSRHIQRNATTSELIDYHEPLQRLPLSVRSKTKSNSRHGSHASLDDDDMRLHHALKPVFSWFSSALSVLLDAIFGARVCC